MKNINNKNFLENTLDEIQKSNNQFLKDNLLVDNSRYLPDPFNSDRENEFVKDSINPTNLYIEPGDILFVISNPTNLTNNSQNTLNIKLFFPKEFYNVNYIRFFDNLNKSGTSKLQFIIINDNFKKEFNNPFIVKDYNVLNIIKTNFMDFLNSGIYSFGEYNKYSLFLLKNGTYSQIKSLFQIADREYIINFGKGSQKAHICSDIELRLFYYLLALYNFDFNYVRYTNNFNNLDKGQYTTYKDTTHNNKFILNTSNPQTKVEVKDIRSNIIDINKIHRKSFHTNTRLAAVEASSKEVLDINLESFTYLDEIENIIENSETLEEAQSKIEDVWMDLIKEKLNNPNSSVWKNIKTILEKSTKIIENHGNSGVLRKRFKVDKNIIIKLRYEIVFLTISIMISGHGKYSSTHLFINNGKNISSLLYKYYVSNSIDEDILEYKDWSVKYKLETSTELLKIGYYFAQIFMNEPLEIFTLEVSEEEDNPVQVLKISENWIDTIKDTLIIQPSSLPMICKPVEWSDTKYGGYIKNSLDKKDIIIGSNYHGHEVNKLQKIYDVVNIMNSVKFRINNNILKYITNNPDILDIDELDKTSKLQLHLTLKLAEIYKNLTFYLNVNSDWRGRLYTSSFFLNYQGSDLSRALLEFSEGQVLNSTGLKYLHIYGANCYSGELSKKSYEKRIEWVLSNEDKIVSLDREFINKANKKIQFLAFCLSYIDYKNNPNSLIHLPIFLDATCSGVQHLAAMLQDVNLAKEVNLLESVNSKDAEDIYSTVSEYINKEINKNNDNKKFKDIKLNRKILKTSIMTQVYNVKISGIFNQLKSKLEIVEKFNEKTKKSTKYYLAPTKSGGFIELNYLEVYDIAAIVSRTIFDIYPPLKEVYDYFINMVKLMLKISIPVVWITPSGLEITQFYYTSEVTKVKLSYFGKNRTAVIREWKPIIDNNKQSLAIIPNIIHSLDASHLFNVVLEGYDKKCSPIITIHDCFGTHPNNMEYLSKIIRNEFINLYTKEDFINKYHENVYKAIKDNQIKIYHKDGKDYVKHEKYGRINIPSKPIKGNLDLSRISNAIYLVC